MTLILTSCSDTSAPSEDSTTTTKKQPETMADAPLIQYLEIVTPKVDETCAALGKVHGVTFSEPVPNLGNARTATMKDGGRIGVRGPMRPDEEPVVRPYILTKDIEAAVKAAQEAGAEIAMPAMEIPGEGKFAIYILGGIDHGLWQLP